MAIIKSKNIEKLQPAIIKAASEIKKAIQEKRKIYLRHHADTDGYSAAIVLERAILPLIENKQTRERDVYNYYRRLPSKAPYYDYSDATKDLTNYLADIKRFDHKTPLILIVDNGSTDSDLLGLKKITTYGAKVIVIDHHPAHPKVNDYLIAHVNQHLIGVENDFSASMLASEVAYELNPKIENPALLAAIGGIGDRIKSSELNDYIKKSNNSKEFIEILADCVDFEAHTLGFSDSRTLVNDLFGADKKKQSELISVMSDEMKRRKLTAFELAKTITKTQNTKNAIIATVDNSQVSERGAYPGVGKTTGMLFDWLKHEKQKPVIVISHNESMITLRSSHDKFKANKIIKKLQDTLPKGLISGGGHDVAASIRFSPLIKKEVLEKVIAYAKKC
ncbi:hypothetical protein GOV04_02905 [Candidatus Woesearchaeota archaeon]|nr:hypothetical protein [Candidatus Woesearchaeota archaeon]